MMNKTLYPKAVFNQDIQTTVHNNRSKDFMFALFKKVVHKRLKIYIKSHSNYHTTI